MVLVNADFLDTRQIVWNDSNTQRILCFVQEKIGNM
jgi:hypothetical protein